MRRRERREKREGKKEKGKGEGRREKTEESLGQDCTSSKTGCTLYNTHTTRHL
jgi:hypothetical protein